MDRNYYDSSARVLDTSCYFNLDYIIEEKVMSQMADEDLDMVLKTIDLGRRHAKSAYQYNRDLEIIINNWSTAVMFQELDVSNDKKYINNNDTYINNNLKGQCIKYKEDVNGIMRTLIPNAYFILALVFFAPAILFAVFFLLSVFRNIDILNPITSLVMFVGSFGMFLTILSAIQEWKRIER